MNHRIAIRRLWWKELRQLAPMIAMLIVIALFLQLILLIPGPNIEETHAVQLAFLIGLPGLFAVGAGALLIGQEKELKTIRWLSSLPIPPRQLLRTKLLACLLGLAAMWVVSFMLTMLFTLGNFRVSSQLSVLDEGSLTIGSWILHSLFLLLAGIALAWRFQSSLISLIAIVPIALLPALTAWILTNITSSGEQPTATSILLGCQLFFVTAALLWGWRVGIAALGPARAANAHSLQQRRVASPVVYSNPHTPFSALLWQAFTQNRAALIGCSSLAILAALLGFGISTDSYFEPVLTSGLCGFAAVSWLGSSVFQGDKLHSRIRFLADRGVSPRAVWLSRHAAPVAVLVVGSIIAACILTTNMFDSANMTDFVFAGFAFLGITLLVYIVSQWASQLFSSPIVAAIGGPALSCGAVGYVVFSYNNLGTPVWLIGLCTLLPLLATFLLMRPWMDCNTGKRFWCMQAGLLACFTLVPAAPFALDFATTKSMSFQTHNEIFDTKYRRTTKTQPTELILSTDRRIQDYADGHSGILPEGAQFAEDIESVPVADQAALAKRSLRNQLARNPGSIQATVRILDFLRSEIVLTRLRLDEPTAESNHTKLAEHYNDTLRLASTIVSRARLSNRLIDQDKADLIEIMLLRELLLSKDQDWLEAETLKSVTNQLADRKARNEARQRAVALSWRNFGDSDTTLGGYHLPSTVTSNFRTLALRNRRIGCVVEVLWNYAKKSTGSTTELRTELASFWYDSAERYGLGPHATFRRANSAEKFLSSSQRRTVVPGTQWHAGWETEAQQLALEIQ